MDIERIALVAFENEIAWGLRSIAEYLRSKGFVVALYFLGRYANIPRGVPEASLDRFVADFVPTPRDVVGIGFMTPDLGHARQLAAKVRPQGATIVVGGIHPTVCPGDCLPFADYIVRGAGEDSLLELLHALQRGEPPRKGVYHNGTEYWFNDDVTKFPYPRYGVVEDTLIVGGHVARTTEVPRRIGLVTRYQTFTSFGCPYFCTFCVNPILQQLTDRRGKNFLRSRTHDDVIAEIRHVRERIDAVSFEDEDFLVDAQGVMVFLEQYKKEIDLPFNCLATPTTLKPATLDRLVERMKASNCVSVNVGLQSASPRTAKLFKRPLNLEWLLTVGRAFARRNIVITYDVILGNPFEDESDVTQTVMAVLDLPHPLELNVFYLTFFPGYVLTDQAIELGVAIEADGDTRTSQYGTLLEEWVIRMAQIPFVPRSLLRALYRRRSSGWARGLILAMGKVLVPLWINRGVSMARMGLMHPGFALRVLAKKMRGWLAASGNRK